ncbi:MAG: dihydropteroate synthase [Deltaproteobacteria bacterium]|nr:dihydropteroate synthase [Deltaproteobacteria bacterium]MBW2052323.1 dihydropteroate synthase [Deltaproteobacteria bacterium]MBW2140224.1 dihydropteroate synthase [Deltaproteobacteria bacterium]MBW2323474.1 dihydropteroate synthase [Deltaproteobacteria bacterium]
MGVINVTPDSFSDGGDCYAHDTAVTYGLRLAEAGADILDIGGESTRPGAESVSEDEELRRVIPVIEGLAGKVDVPLSVDTCKAGVAEAALKAGASIVNDISAGRMDPKLLHVTARAGVPLILMHMKGEPRTMQVNPTYKDLIGEIKSFLLEAANRAEKAGVSREMIIIDPGIGFGKTFDHNLTLINRLEEIINLEYLVMIGASRKAFLGKILGGALPKERDIGTAAVTALAAYKGAHILRVHNIELAKQTLAVVNAVKQEKIKQDDL